MAKISLKELGLVLKKMAAIIGTTYAKNIIFGASGNGHSAGLVPDPGNTAGSAKYLCEDGTWQIPARANHEVATVADNGRTAGAITLDGAKPLYLITLTGAVTSVAFTSGKLPEAGRSCHVIFRSISATTVSMAHIDTGAVRYICPAGENPDDLEVPAGGYVEMNLLRAPDSTEGNSTVSWIYVRGI